MKLPEGWHCLTPRIVTDDVGGLVEFLVEDRWGNVWQLATFRAAE